MVGSLATSPASLRMKVPPGFPSDERWPPEASMWEDVQPPPVLLLGTTISKSPLVMRLTARAAVGCPTTTRQATSSRALHRMPRDRRYLIRVPLCGVRLPRRDPWGVGQVLCRSAKGVRADSQIAI